MGQVKQIEIGNRIFFFYNDKISFKNFESNLLKIDKNITKALIFTTLDTSQLKKIGDSKNICNVNPLYLLLIMHVDILRKKREINTLVFC